MDRLEQRAIYLVNTSVDDTKTHLSNCKIEDLPVLQRALEISEARHHKTRIKYLRSRIRQLTKQQESPK